MASPPLTNTVMPIMPGKYPSSKQQQQQQQSEVIFEHDTMDVFAVIDFC